MKHPDDVVTIIPALPGWRALYALSDAASSEAQPHEQPIAVWALIDEGRHGRHVVGYTAEEYIDTAECDQFVRYLAPGEKAADFQEQVDATYRAVTSRRRAA